MHKLIVILTLTLSILGFTVAAEANGNPPACGDTCPFVR
jgi:hypothetical protein